MTLPLPPLASEWMKIYDFLGRGGCLEFFSLVNLRMKTLNTLQLTTKDTQKRFESGTAGNIAFRTEG
jgi:hypothetical protein